MTYKKKITHIIRGEDHIANTAFHIQIFKALGASIPTFAHHPFLTDDEGKGFKPAKISNNSPAVKGLPESFFKG